MPDWAFPVLLAGDKVTPRLPLSASDRASRLEAVAAAFRCDNNPPVLCDRFDVLGSYDELVAAHRAGCDPWVLVLEVTDSSAGDAGGPRYGMTRLLEELAARAVYDGFLPAFVRSAPDPVPTKEIEVAELILQAANDALALFREPPVDDGQVAALLAIQAGEPDPGLDPDIKKVHRSSVQRPGKLAAMALRRDLVSLATQRKRPPLILLDSVHLWGNIAVTLTTDLLVAVGLGTDARFPVIMTCNTRITQAGHNLACDALKKFIETAQPHVRPVQIGAFAERVAPLAYLQYLLHRKQPLVPAPDLQQKILARLHKIVAGIPLRLRSEHEELKGTIETYIDCDHIKVADDDAVLQGIK